MTNPAKAIDNLIFEINHDSYLLTRGDVSEIENALKEVKERIISIYAKRGKSFI